MKKNTKLDLNSILFALYHFAVWAIYLFVHRYSYGGSKIDFVFSLMGIFLITVPASFLLLKYISKLSIKDTELRWSRKGKFGLISIFFCLNLIVLLVWFVAYFPGGFSPDSINQYEQAISDNYNDWHPFLHTVLFFSIPLKLAGNPSAIVLFQIVAFAGILAYCAVSISRHFGIKIALFSNAYIVLNPYTGSIAVYPWKDVGFAMVALFIAVCIFNIYYLER